MASLRSGSREGTMPRLMDQDRALAAHKAVMGQRQGWRGDDRLLKEYRQELQQLPSRILSSGLGQTLAFYASKAGPEASASIHGTIGAELARFLTGEKEKSTVGLLNEIMSGDTSHYRRRTREALAYAEWLKRYAAALIEKPKKPRKGEQ